MDINSQLLAATMNPQPLSAVSSHRRQWQAEAGDAFWSYRHSVGLRCWARSGMHGGSVTALRGLWCLGAQLLTATIVAFRPRVPETSSPFGIFQKSSPAASHLQPSVISAHSDASAVLSVLLQLWSKPLHLPFFLLPAHWTRDRDQT